MKICPTCRRTYEDDGLNFCLEDGSVLTFSPRDAAEPTLVMNQPRPTLPTADGGIEKTWDVRNANPTMQPKKKSSKAWLWVAAIFVVLILLCGGGFAGFFFYVASVADRNANGSKGVTNTNTARTNSFSNKSPEPSPGEVAASVQEVDLSKHVKVSVYGRTEFTDGEFFMAALEKGFYYVVVSPDDHKTDGARTRVIVRNPDLSDSDLGYGLIVHSDTTPLENDYAFLIDSKRKRYRVVRHEPDDEVTVKAWTNSSLINEGSAENALEVRDKGQTLEFYINSQLATTVANKQGPKGGVPGLYSGDGARIGFKKLEIVK